MCVLYPQIYVTERSRQLLRDVRLRGGLRVECYFLFWNDSFNGMFLILFNIKRLQHGNYIIEVKMYKTGIIELAGW